MNPILAYFYQVTGLGLNLSHSEGTYETIGPVKELNLLIPTWQSQAESITCSQPIELHMLPSGFHTIVFKIDDYKGYVHPFYIGDLSMDAVDRLKFLNNIHSKDAYYHFKKLTSVSNTRLGFIMNFIENMLTHENVSSHTEILFEPEILKTIKVNLEHPPLHDYENEKVLMAHIADGETGKALEILLFHLNNQNFTTLGDSALRSLKNNAIVYVTLAVRAGIQGGVDVDKALTLADRFIIHIEKAIHFEDLLTLNYRFTESLCSMVNDSKDDDRILRKIRAFIEGHLDEKISRGQLAAHVNLSASYLSRYIKEKSELNLTDFLHSIRLEHAKKLLVESDMNLLDIALSCGYDTQNYFSSCFKKYVGLTPAKFRRNYSTI